MIEETQESMNIESLWTTVFPVSAVETPPDLVNCFTVLVSDLILSPCPVGQYHISCYLISAARLFFAVWSLLKQKRLNKSLQLEL